MPMWTAELEVRSDDRVVAVQDGSGPTMNPTMAREIYFQLQDIENSTCSSYYARRKSIFRIEAVLIFRAPRGVLLLEGRSRGRTQSTK